MASSSICEAKWGQRWRSSPVFIVAAMATALFTDTFLYTFIVPILPYMLKSRLGLDDSLLQTMSFWLLAETAGISVVLSPLIGHYADKVDSKRIWLLSALVIALASTLGVALATSMFGLFASRFVQAVASTIIWVVGYATVADNIPKENTGRTYSAISMAVAAGTSSGPMLSGILFQVGGYWVAWSSAFVILVIDIVLRLLMLERPRENNNLNSVQNRGSSTGSADHENSPLLPRPQHESSASTEKGSGLQYYKLLFSQPNFVGGIIGFMVFSAIRSSFSTTLPLHVQGVFHWGSLPAGLMFAALQGPSFILSPFVGWLKDRIGTREPTTLGFAILAPLFWLIGTPGDERFPWANENNRGPLIYTMTILGIGIVSTLLNGSGTIEATLTVHELEKKHPGISGPNGGYSRAISICSMAFTIGSFIGPILSGLITDRVGYYEMSCSLGVLCVVSGVVSFATLTSTWKRNVGSQGGHE